MVSQELRTPSKESRNSMFLSTFKSHRAIKLTWVALLAVSQLINKLRASSHLLGKAKSSLPHFMVSSWVKHIKICISSVYLSLRVTCLGEPMAASQSPNCSKASSAFGEKLFTIEVSGSSQCFGKCLPQPLLNQRLNGEERLQFQVNSGHHNTLMKWTTCSALPMKKIE